MRQRHLLWGVLCKLQPAFDFCGSFPTTSDFEKNSSTTGNLTKPPSRSSIESSFRLCAHAPSMEPTANHKHVKMCKQNMLLPKAGESEKIHSRRSKMAGESENGGDGPPLGSWRFRTWKPSSSRFHSSNLGGSFCNTFQRVIPYCEDATRNNLSFCHYLEKQCKLYTSQ